MSNSNQHIEEIFRKTFEDYTVKPSRSLWPNIRSRLMVREFFKFKFTSFNIYYVSVLLTGTAITFGTLKNHYSNNSNFKENLNNQVAVNQNTQPAVQNITPGTEFKPEKNNIAAFNHTNKTVISNQTIQLKQSPAVNSGQASESNNGTKQGIISEKEDKENKNLSPPQENNSENADVLSESSLPVADFNVSDKAGCPPFKTKFKNTSVNGTWQKWEFGDGSFSYEENPYHIYSEPGTFTAILKIKGENKKYYTRQENITVYDHPIASFKIDDFNSLVDDKKVSFLNFSIDNYKNYWNFGDGSLSSEQNPVHYYKYLGEYMVTLKVSNENGCIDSSTIKNIYLKSEYYISFPNAFVPDQEAANNGYYNEGSNRIDIFYPVSNGVTSYRLRIYNRTGMLMFETSDIKVGWNGYYNDQLAPQDVYIYEATGKFMDGTSFSKKGDITLIAK